MFGVFTRLSEQVVQISRPKSTGGFHFRAAKSTILEFYRPFSRFNALILKTAPISVGFIWKYDEILILYKYTAPEFKYVRSRGSQIKTFTFPKI